MTVRLITNRDYPGGSVEWIEISEDGYFTWKADDKSNGCFASFPADIKWVEKMFAENERVLDISRLPKNYVANPYSVEIKP